MREIKFRAYWNKKDNPYMPPKMWLWEDIKKYPIPNGSNGLLSGLLEQKHENWNVMQYTGLKDSDEQEIYEGDIIKGHIEYGGSMFDPPEVEGYLLVVEWDDENAQFVFKDVFSGEAFPGNDAPEFDKVMGNIYENPDLLKFDKE